MENVVANGGKNGRPLRREHSAPSRLGRELISKCRSKSWNTKVSRTRIFLPLYAFKLSRIFHDAFAGQFQLLSMAHPLGSGRKMPDGDKEKKFLGMLSYKVGGNHVIDQINHF